MSVHSRQDIPFFDVGGAAGDGRPGAINLPRDQYSVIHEAPALTRQNVGIRAALLA